MLRHPISSVMSVLLAGASVFASPMDEAWAESAPRVTKVIVSGYTGSSATFGLDAVFELRVEFDQSVEVTGKPQLVVEIGSQKRNLDLYAGYAVPGAGVNYGGVRHLYYEYYVQASEVGPVVATGIDLNGGTIRSTETEESANLVFERIEIGNLSLVNGRDQLSSPGSAGNGYLSLRPYNWPQSGDTYRVGEEIQIAVFSNVALTVTGTPQVPLIIGARTRYANYVPALSVASQPIFSYTVQEADIDDNGIQYGGPTPWRMNGGSVVLRGHKTSAIISASSYKTGWIYVGSNHPDADEYGDIPANVNGGGSGTSPGSGAGSGTGTPNRPATPLVSSVEFKSSPQYESTYRLDEEILVHVRFSDPVTVTGTPQLGLTIGAQTRQAAYHADESEGADEMFGLSAGSILGFTYTVQASDLAPNGIGIVANALSLNGGTISRVSDSTTAASLTHTAVATDATRKVDGRLRMPARFSVLRQYNEPSRDRTFRLGEEMLFVGHTRQPVTVTGTPRLQLLFGEGTLSDYFSSWRKQVPPGQTTRYADYDAARSQPDRLIFSYTVQAGDSDVDGIIVPNAPIRLNGGSIVERAHPTNHVDLSGPEGGALQLGCGPGSGGASCKVDGGGTTTGGGTNPGGSTPEPRLRVNTVRLTGTPASEATYRLGEQIQAAVTFTEAVTVTGTPQIGLSIGTQTRQAVYDATQSKGMLVVFSYSVQATDADADGISIAANALTLNSGTITLASDTTTAAALDHAGVGTDDTRKVDGSTDVVEHGNSREQATLLVLSARTTGEVGETGQENDVQVGVATARSAEVAGALEQTGDADYFRVEVPGAGRLTVETTGATDTVGTLLGATGQALTEDDDGGTESNFRVERSVQAGTYYVAVTGGESERVVGLYTLAVRFTPARGGTTVGNVAPPPGGNTPPRGITPPAGSPPPARGATGDREARQPTALRLNTKTTGRLDRAGEVDYFRVEVQEAGTVTVEASGAAAPLAYFGAGDEPALPARAGVRAVQAAWPVTAGTYHVAVVGGPGRTRTGAYTVAVRFTAASEAGPLRATLLNVAPAHAWVHFYCGRAQHSEAAACTAQVQCGQLDGAPVAWDVTVPAETLRSYWPGRRAADGTSADFAAALGAVGTTEEVARQRTTCRVFSPDPLEVRAYTQVAGELVPVAHLPAPVDATAPTRVATLLNLAPAHARVHLACRKTQTADGEPVDPCAVRLQCGQQDGTPVSWDVDVVAETTLTYGPGGTSDDLAAALVAAGKTETEARRRTTCQVFSRDPLDAWAYTRVGGDLVSVTNPPAAVDAVAPTRVATLLNVAPAHAWVHFYCRKAHDPDGGTVDPCNVRLQCGQQDGAPVSWDVNVAPETIFAYWPDKTAADGTAADFAAALVAAGKAAAEARRRTTCQVFSTDPVDVRGYTQLGGAVVPVANPPVVPAADAPTRIGTLLNVAPTQAWVHFYCRKTHQPDAETADPCNVQLQCGQQDGPSVAWDVDVASETIFSYWPGRTAADGTPDNLAAALVAAGKTTVEARRRTTCQVFSADPMDVRGYTQLDETVVPVKN